VAAATATRALRRVEVTRYVTPLREGGSLPGLVEAADLGSYVLKFSGAGQGPRTLAAEILAGELARALGLLVPDLVVAELDPMLGKAEPDPEIRELVEASPGANLGVDFLPGALPYVPAAGWEPTPELAADVVWLDALLTNVDRTAQNPNLLVWHDRLWLIDHGAALYLQHAGLRPELAERPFPQIAAHVLLPRAGAITSAHERLAARLDEDHLEAIVGLVPPEWWAGADPAVYVEYVARRLRGPFAEEAERARTAA
jgi:hypothetical protein